MASARGQVPLGMLPPGHRVTIEHPAFPEPTEGEFVQIYQTSSGAGKTVLLFFMDKETGVAVQEKYRCMVLSNSITEADMGRVLVLHEDELHGVKVTPRPVLRCRGCQHGHGVDDLIARHGLLPFDLMSREMRRLEEQLRSKQVPGARRWAQQAVVAMQGDEDEAVRWVQIEYKKQGPWPPQVSCGVKECKTVLECMELSFWLDEEVRKALSTEEAMRDQAAAADGQGQEEEAADMVPPYRPPMSPKSRLRGMKRPLTGGPDAQREAREAASRQLRREEEEEAGSSQQGRSWLVQVSSSSTGTPATSSPGSARGGGRSVEVQQAGGKSPSSMVGPAKASKRPRPSQQGPHGGGGGGGGRQTDMKQFVFRKTFSPTALAEEEAREDVVSALVGMGFDPAQARRAARGGATLHAALEKLEEMQKEEEQQQGGRGDDESKMRVFDYDSGDDEPRVVVPERGVLRSCQPIKVFWQGESETRTANVDVVRDSLPTWEAFQSKCAEKLGLDTSRLFIDCLEVLRRTALGMRRTEIRSIEDLQRELGPGGMHVEVKTVALDPTPVLVDNMGPEEPIASLLHELVHSPAMQRQIWDLKPRYPRWRRVRGDGNCYYRAVMFGLCLQCLVDPQRMKKLKALVRKTTSLPRDMADKLLKWLEDDAGRLPLEQDFTNTDTGVDEGLVLLARYALSDFIRKQRHASFSGGLSMQQMAEAEGMTLEDYCRQHIETMGVDAEGFQLDLGLLPYILELTCHTWVVQRNTLELVCITRPSGPPRSLEISLLLVPGHYSFLVPRQPGEPEEEDEQQQYEQQSPYFGIPSPISPGTWHQARDDSCLTPLLPSSPIREDMSGLEEKSELAVESGRVEPGSQEEEAEREGSSSDDRGQEDGDLDHATDLSYPAQQGESSMSAAPTTPVELAEDRGVQHEETQQQGRDSLCIDGSAPVLIDGVGNWLNRVKGVVQDLIVKKLG